jgi:hypothetical protein
LREGTEIEATDTKIRVNGIDLFHETNRVVRLLCPAHLQFEGYDERDHAGERDQIGDHEREPDGGDEHGAEDRVADDVEGAAGHEVGSFVLVAARTSPVLMPIRTRGVVPANARCEGPVFRRIAPRVEVRGPSRLGRGPCWSGRADGRNKGRGHRDPECHGRDHGDRGHGEGRRTRAAEEAGTGIGEQGSGQPSGC